jgi:hypothetical protein
MEEAMVPKKIAMKSFAEFVSGTESAKARILRGYKYPDDEGRAMATYYWSTKSAITEFHTEKHGIEWLQDKVKAYDQNALTPNKSLRIKMLNNARSLKSYAEHFGDQNYEVLGTAKFPFTLGGVTINVTPDIHISDGGMEKYVKFSFSKDKLKHEYVRAMVACMSYALHVHLEAYHLDAVSFIDIPRGIVHRGLKVTETLVDEIVEQCKDLEKAWDSL